MFIDNLTLAGIAAASLFILLPFVFGKEFLRVDQEPKREPQRDLADEALHQREFSDC